MSRSDWETLHIASWWVIIAISVVSYPWTIYQMYNYGFVQGFFVFSGFFWIFVVTWYCKWYTGKKMNEDNRSIW